MAFERIIGQHKICDYLSRTVGNDRTSHAYLFVGEKGVGKEALAIEFARLLLCPDALKCNRDGCVTCAKLDKLTHPDLYYIFPAPAKINEDERRKILDSVAEDPYRRMEMWSNPSISIDAIRDLRKKASYKSFEGSGRVMIMADCERMTTEAANALLKILEEPPDDMYLFMTSSRAHLLLPTITSRCQTITVEPLSVAEIKQALIERKTVDTRTAELAARMSGGSYRNAVEHLEEDIEGLQKQALEFFRSSVQSNFTQVVHVDKLMAAADRDAQKIRKMLSFLLLWFRDAMVFREAGDLPAASFYNSDETEVLRKFTEKFPDADLFRAVQEIEKSLQLFDRNIQINLVLIVLLAKLRTLIRRL
jgi:DNA polymerase-3 subunit delta'